MRRSVVFVVLFALLSAAPAAAQSPPPTLLRFDATDPPGLYTAQGAPSCPAPFPSTTAPLSAPTFLFAPCAPTLKLTFTTPQASAQLFVRTGFGTANRLVATAQTAAGPLTVSVDEPSTWKPVSFAAAGITSVEVRAEGSDIGVDDLAISPVAQPDTTFDGGPSGREEATTATFAFAANRPDVVGFRCSLDDAAPASCTSPVSLQALALGEHTFKVATVDAYGAVDATPAERTWTVLGPLPDTQLPPGITPTVTGDTVQIPLGQAANLECALDGGPFTPCTAAFSASGLTAGPHTLAVRAVDAFGRPDPTPETFTFDVARRFPAVIDADQDGIPDNQEQLPLGNVPPVAGERTIAQLGSGTVIVRLPDGRVVPLSGLAALPVGATIDARRGELTLRLAADGRPATDPRRAIGTATIAAGIFRIRQAKLRKGVPATRVIETTLVLVSPPNAERGCRRRVPAKGVVRTLKVAVKGRFAVSAGASRARARNAAFQTTDRCRGTTTRVTRGRVSVLDKARKRTRLLRAHQRYVAKARLFAARRSP